MQPSRPRFEYRAWAEAFPDLPRPEGEPFADEVYLIPLGLGGRDIKIRGGALEMKDLLLEQDGLPLWQPAVRLEFPIPARLVERELLERLALNQVLRRQRYTQEELLEELAEARRNIAVVPVQKRRRLFEVAGCRAESGEVLVAGRRLLTAAAEHETPDALRRAVGEMKIAKYPNLDYPAALTRLLPLHRAA
jgi:hypothetical protein